MIGDDNQEQIEYQNRCARHAEFYEGCGPCTGNATEEFLLERNYQQHLKQNITDASLPMAGTSAALPINLGMTEGWAVKVNIRPEDLAKRLEDEAVKDDESKPRYDLLPPNALNELVAVYTMGAKKYAPRNWEKGLRWGRVFAALMRHAWAWWSGESRDHESGLNHMAHVAWCALALAEYNMSPKNVGEDDRPMERIEPPEYFQTSPYSVSIFDSIGVMVAHATFVDYEEARDFVTREILNYHGGHAHIKNRQGTVMWEGVHD